MPSARPVLASGSMSSSISIRTFGYWPLPRFVRIFSDGKWNRLKLASFESKSAIYSTPTRLSHSSLVILEAQLKGALPREIRISASPSPLHPTSHSSILLRRWMGGLYSNCNPASISQVRRFYAAIASRYSRHVEPTRAHQLAAFVPLFPLHSRVLDASAGDGTFARVASSRLEVWCNDLCAEMLSLCPRQLVPSSHRTISSASRLPHPASSFDGVLHSFSNLHSWDQRAFSSFHRVLKMGGLLIYHPVKAPGERWPKEFQTSVLSALKSAGFSKVETRWVESAGAKKTRLQVFLAQK